MADIIPVNIEAIGLVENNRNILVAALQSALRETTFSNRMLLAPRRLKEIGQEEATVFLIYLESPDPKTVFEHGKHLASEGLGHRSLTALATGLRRACWQIGQSDIDTWSSVLLGLVDDYVGTLTEGYIAGCEEDVRRELKLTHEAYQRSIERSAAI